MKIDKLFLKDIARPIDGVIKADDERHLDIEVEEFVITRDVGKALNEFVERYLGDPNANGVWISGFFGSGKSHLLKILSLLLDERTLPSGRKPADVILPHIEDELLRADMARAVKIPSHSILFNIAQKTDHRERFVNAQLTLFLRYASQVKRESHVFCNTGPGHERGLLEHHRHRSTVFMVGSILEAYFP